jgi:RNA polymerase sigma-70 factor (sigma-E family)
MSDGSDDNSGFDEFYRASQRRVGTFLYAVCGDLSEAQDAAQEAYARAWQRWSTIATYDDPEAWVRTVGYRLVLNRWRKARNRLIAHRRHGPGGAVAPPTEDVVALVAALRRLPAEQRLAITLHHLLDLPVAEVAQQTGVSANTIKARLTRGRRTLAALLKADLPEESIHA